MLSLEMLQENQLERFLWTMPFSQLFILRHAIMKFFTVAAANDYFVYFVAYLPPYLVREYRSYSRANETSDLVWHGWNC